jgi:hypothetical protein
MTIPTDLLLATRQTLRTAKNLVPALDLHFSDKAKLLRARRELLEAKIIIEGRILSCWPHTTRPFHKTPCTPR